MHFFMVEKFCYDLRYNRDCPYFMELNYQKISSASVSILSLYILEKVGLRGFFLFFVLQEYPIKGISELRKI